MPLGAELAELAAKNFKSLESGFMHTEAGADLANLLKNKYIPEYHASLEKHVQIQSALPAAQRMAPHEIESLAKNEARLKSLGQNDYRGVGLIKAVANDSKLKGNPAYVHQAQQALADNVHMFLRDTKPSIKGPQSVFKENVNRLGEGLKVDTGAIYRPPTEAEGFIKRLVSVPMLAGIVIPHLGTPLNYIQGTHFTDLARGIAEATFNGKNVKQWASSSANFGPTLMDAYSVAYNGERGILAKTVNENFGRIVAQMTHSPGFNSWRTWTLAIGAATGKLHTERLAQDLIASKGTDKAAIIGLKRLGIEAKDVLAAGGLNPDLLRRGVYNYTDSRVFINNTMARSFNSSRNVYHRLGLMYHGYIARQGAFMVNAIKNDVLKNQMGLVNAAKTLGLMGVAFPTVGVGIKTMQMWGRGQFNTDFIDEEEQLFGRDGLSKAGEEWIEGMSHMAAFGVANDYIRATNRHMLLQTAVGPVGNEAANLLQDGWHAGSNFNSDDPNKSFKPLERDILYDTLPDNIGKILAHRYLKTAKEEKESKSSTKLKKLKGLKLKKLPKLN